MARRLVPVAVTLALAVGAVVGRVTPASALRSPVCTRGMTTVQVDPRGLLPLTGANPIGPATVAALRLEKKAARPQIVAATLATRDDIRGPEARFSCGRRVWQRTVVVYITDRAELPSQSASQRVYFVGRFAHGYRVWQIVH